jgi:hypothetical protein
VFEYDVEAARRIKASCGIFIASRAGRLELEDPKDGVGMAAQRPSPTARATKDGAKGQQQVD